MRNLEQLTQDTRYALRGLRKSPGFTAAVILTLGLGIGANTAMYNVIDQLMFRSHPFLRDPAQVQRVYLRVPGRERLFDREAFPYARYLDLKQWTTSFSDYAAFFPTDVAVGTGDAVRERPIVAVSASFWRFFDAPPALGRYFVAAEDTTPSGAEVVVIAHSYWKNEFGGRNVIGETLLIDNVRSTIIGVAPEGFIGVAESDAPVAYVPITTFGGHQSGGSSREYWRTYQWDWTEMMVRRQPDVSVARANADLTQAFIRSRDVARSIHTWMPRSDAMRPLAIVGSLRTAGGPYMGLEARTLLWITGVAGVVFLIACANVANLILARTMRRRRELTLRLALGASWRRLASQALVEGGILACLGGTAGVVIAQVGGSELRRLFLSPATAVSPARDWQTLGIALAIATLAALFTSLAPMLVTRKPDLVAGLRSGVHQGSSQRSRLRAALLISQSALSVALLIGAGLFIQSLLHVRQLQLGYSVEGVVLAHWSRRGERMDAGQQGAVRARVSDAAQAIPGVERTAWASNVPLMGTSTMPLFVSGIDSVSRLGRFTYQIADVDYFSTIGTRLVRGREFTDADRVGTPAVTIVSARMARLLWPGKGAIGECIRVGADTMPCTTVIGIAQDAVHDPVKDQPLRYYLPVDQHPNEGTSWLVLRLRDGFGSAGTLEEVRKTLQAVLPGQQYVTVERMEGLYDSQRRSWELGASMFVAFGILALLVAAVGLYGVIAYNVTQRMHDLAVRIALGAQRAQVVGLAVSEGLKLAGLGLVIGTALALAAAPWLQPLLFQQSARDPVIVGVVSVVLLAVALIASSAPAVRAARADPNTVLRAE